MKVILCLLALYWASSFLVSTPLIAQSSVSEQRETETVATSALLDSVGPFQRKAIESVYVIRCSETHGTGFLVESGIIVTNAHVVEGCTSDSVLATSMHGKELRFSKIVSDNIRDLALLVPSEKVKGGLQLGKDKTIKVGENVTSWGFPLIYTSGAPLLTVGYVAGFNEDIEGDKHTKHMVVNGAFNPGNSGGPVFKANDNKVIGIVVWRQRLTSPNVPTVIKGLGHPRAAIGGNFSRTLPNGQVVPISDQEAISGVLNEFYNLVQVMIGEAITVSELQDFMAEKSNDLK